MRSVIELDKYFKEVEVTEEPWTDIDGSMYVDQFKKVILSEALMLEIWDDGSAVFTMSGTDYIFKWDEEASAMFSRFYDVKAVELLELINRKRWKMSA